MTIALETSLEKSAQSSPRGKNVISKMSIHSKDVLADLRQLEQVFRTGVDCDIESVCSALGKKYEETTRWIKSVKPFIDASTFQKDEIGRALIPEDVVDSSELIALKSTANGDCLFNIQLHSCYAGLRL